MKRSNLTAEEYNFIEQAMPILYDKRAGDPDLRIKLIKRIQEIKATLDHEMLKKINGIFDTNNNDPLKNGLKYILPFDIAE